MWKAALILLACSIAPTGYADGRIELVEDLITDGQRAAEQKKLILLLVTQPDCSTCEYVKSHHINPMLRNGELQNRAIVREVDLAGITFTDFNGDDIEPETFALRYGANFSPSVLFLASDGKQLQEPLIGVESRDYYAYYLEKSIRKSAALLQ